MWVISLPLSVRVSGKKTFTLNLNQYRNTHFRTLNTAKVNYEGLVRRLIRKKGLPKMSRVELEYTVYPGSHVQLDVSNVCSIVEKFFCDSLVSSKILPDDNYKHVLKSTYMYGHVDIKNPRVDVLIRSLDKVNKGINTMKIILTNEEVLSALQEHIGNLVQISEDTDMSLELLEDGSVEVILTKDNSEEETSTDTASQKPARKTARRTRRTKEEMEAARAAETAQEPEPKKEEPAVAESEPEQKPVEDLAGPTSLFGEDTEEEEAPQNDSSDMPDASDLFKDH